MTTAVEPRLTRNWSTPTRSGSTATWPPAATRACARRVAMADADIVEVVKASGLRGRGGAGFPTGMKWGFVPRDTGKPTYVVVNFDESEPGTCNNRELVEREPHRLLEGTAIAALAIGCETAFIYVRGEYLWQSIVLERAIAEAYAGGYLGADVAGSGTRVDVVLHRGAGAYICGEETALLNSLEGLRGQPRLRPPFPAVEGLYASPTVINNVETLMNVPDIVERGADWFREVGTEKSPGTKMFTISGKVERPGQLRDRARHAVPRGARGARRRDARRRHAEGLDPRRVLDADADRGRTSTSGSTTSRSRRRARCSAPPRSW